MSGLLRAGLPCAGRPLGTGMREGGSYAPGPPTALPGAPRGTGTTRQPSCAYDDAARELRKVRATQ